MAIETEGGRRQAMGDSEDKKTEGGAEQRAELTPPAAGGSDTEARETPLQTYSESGYDKYAETPDEAVKRQGQIARELATLERDLTGGNGPENLNDYEALFARVERQSSLFAEEGRALTPQDNREAIERRNLLVRESLVKLRIAYDTAKGNIWDAARSESLTEEDARELLKKMNPEMIINMAKGGESNKLKESGAFKAQLENLIKELREFCADLEGNSAQVFEKIRASEKGAQDQIDQRTAADLGDTPRTWEILREEKYKDAAKFRSKLDLLIGFLNPSGQVEDIPEVRANVAGGVGANEMQDRWKTLSANLYRPTVRGIDRAAAEMSGKK